MTICIYKITNTVNNKIYVGQTVHFNRRQKEHFKPSGGSIGNKLSNAIQKYGKDVFVHEILESFDSTTENIKQVLNDREQYYLDTLQPFGEIGYNIQRYSEKTNFGLAISDETKVKIGDSLKEYYKTHENPFKGKTHTDEAKRKCALGRKGKKHTDEYKSHMSRVHKELNSIERLKEWHQTHRDPKTKPIIQIHKNDGSFIKVWGSTKEASMSLGIGRTNITNCINGYSTRAGGYKWVKFKDKS